MNWKRCQVRKPMAVFTWVILVALVVIGFATQKDIPGNLANLLSVVGTVIIGGYFGTSGWEACKATKEHEQEETKE